MALSFADYLDKYMNKPNPATGRVTWYSDEIAQAEGVSIDLIEKYRLFYVNADAVNKAALKGPLPYADAVIMWNKAQEAEAAKPVKPRVPSAYPQPGTWLSVINVEQLEAVIAKVVSGIINGKK